MEKRIYWSSIEFKYKNDQNIEFGYTYIFLRAKDVRDCLSKILKALEVENLKPIDIEFIKPYSKETKWEDPERNEHYKKLVQIAEKKKYVIDHLYAKPN
jgi:hypothetical protein